MKHVTVYSRPPSFSEKNKPPIKKKKKHQVRFTHFPNRVSFIVPNVGKLHEITESYELCTNI